MSKKIHLACWIDSPVQKSKKKDPKADPGYELDHDLS
jgi:hypothetical protein